jgi:16S rRNA (cytidine1402-2'-O)-methyltransferase
MDAPIRVKNIIEVADIIFAKTPHLFEEFCKNLKISVNCKVIEHFPGSQSENININYRLIEDFLLNNKTVLMINDSGMPVIEDIGFRSLKIARNLNSEITLIPAPTSASAALVLSGLDCSRYSYMGFPPKNNLINFINEIKEIDHTFILYVFERDLLEFLSEALNFLGKRPSSISKNIGRENEEIINDTLSNLKNIFYKRLKDYDSSQNYNDYVLVISGKSSEK